MNLSLLAYCPFCVGYEDSIEHFAVCPIISQHYHSNGFAYLDLCLFLVLDKDSFPVSTTKLAFLLSSVYLARNSLVHDPSLRPSVVLRLTLDALLSPR